MKKPYCCESSRHLFDQYYSQQQKGSGDFPVYIGRSRQRGHGLADIFSGFARRVLPFLKSLAPHIFNAVSNIRSDVGKGSRWRDAIFKNAPQVLTHIPEALNTASQVQNDQSGSGFRQRRSLKRKRKDQLKKKRNVRSSKRDIFS